MSYTTQELRDYDRSDTDAMLDWAADEIDRLSQPMRWTKNPPTKPGLWWRRFSDTSKWMLRVIELNGALVNADTRYPVESMTNCTWSDLPIPEPEEQPCNP